MKNFWCLLGLFPLSLFAQDVLPTPEKTGENPTLQEIEKSFYEWKNSHDLSEEKGWKWQARYVERMARNTTLGKDAPDESIYFEEAMKNAKRSQKNLRSGANWSPAGPVDRPPTPNTYSNHGMGRINCIEFHPTDENIFWVGVAQGGVWKTTNGGQSYFPLTDNLPILRISDIEVNPNNTDELYISVGDYAYIGVALDLDDRKRHTHYGMGVYKTTDGGATWSPTGLTFNQLQRNVSLVRKVVVNPTNSSEVVAAGVDGIFKSYDAGTTWTEVMDTLIWDLEENPENKYTLFATSGWVKNINRGGAGIWKSTDFGETWKLLPSNIPSRNAAQRVEITLAQQDTNYVYAVACDELRGFYGFFQSTDAGKTWTTKFDKSDSLNILAWSDGIGEVGGQGAYDLAILVDPNDKEKVIVGGVNTWGTEDGGESFNGVSYWVNYFGPSLHADQHQFKYNPLDKKIYVCNDGGLYRADSVLVGDWSQANWGYTWPTTWEDISSGMQITSFYRLGISEKAPGDVIAGAQDNSTFLKSGGSWTNIIGGDGMEAAIHPENSDTIFGSSQYGRIYRSNNGGNSYDYSFTRIIWDGNDRGAWTTPYHISKNNPEIITAGYGDVWRSSNGGATWSRISNFPSVSGLGSALPSSDIAVSNNNPNVVYTAKRLYHSYGEPSQMHVTKDGGTSWQDITTGLPDQLFFTYVTLDQRDPDKVYVTCGGFEDGKKVYFSDDAGSSWTNMSSNLPNVPANSVVIDEKSQYNTVYVAMDVGIYYTNDTASQWHRYADALPNVIVSELEIHYGDRKLYASTFGRGIWMANLLDPEYQGPPATVQREDIRSAKLDVLPNPNAGAFQLVMDQSFANTFLEVVDITGRVIEKQQIVDGVQRIPLSLSLKAGVYFIRVHRGDFYQVKRFVVE